MELPPNEDSVESEASRVPSIGHQPSVSVPAGQEISEIHPEFLKVLKRRSMPHVPQRSSSLTFPPETPPDDSSPSIPVEATTSRNRGWREWWWGFLTGRRPPLAPTPSRDTPVDDMDDAMSTDDEVDDIPMDDVGSSDISESSDGTAIPIAEPPSVRYVTPLSSLWILRRRPVWRPAVHPLVYGFRFSKGWFNRGDTPLNLGCEVLGGPSMFGTRLAQPSQDPEVVEEDSNMDGEDADAVFEHHEDAEPSQDPEVVEEDSNMDGEDADAVVEHHEDAEPSASLDEWHGIPVIEGIDPPTINHGLELDPVSNPPPTPRPAHRNLPSASNTLLDSVQRLNEMISTLTSQEFTDAALLLNLRIERLRISANAASTTSMSGSDEIGGNENTASTDGTIDVVAIVGDGNLTNPDAIDSSIQDTLVATVQDLADNLAQEQSGRPNGVIISIEAVGKDASSPEAGETGESATESEDVDVGNNTGDFGPLERVRSHGPTPPRS
jgi:hypothetical protein